MQTLLQTQPDLSEIAGRIVGELFAHVLGLLEPIFPLAFGEYAPILSVAHVLAVVLLAGLSGLVKDQFRGSADLYSHVQPSQMEAIGGGSVGWLAVALAAVALLATLARYVLLSYLALSAVVFVARLLVGGV